jgi:lipoprotein-anchoring transpeptidase ErfK/SrfK
MRQAVDRSRHRPVGRRVCWFLVVMCAVVGLGSVRASAAEAVPIDVAEPGTAVREERDRALSYTNHTVAVAVVSVRSQRLWVFDEHGSVVFSTKVSTGAGGVSAVARSSGTPPGVHQVTRVVSGRVGEIVRGWGGTGKQARPGRKAYMTTRAFAMSGLERRNRSSQSRGIFLHGTNKPHQLGQAASGGCVRVSDRAAVRLTRLLPSGSLVTVLPN